MKTSQKSSYTLFRNDGEIERQDDYTLYQLYAFLVHHGSETGYMYSLLGGFHLCLVCVLFTNPFLPEMKIFRMPDCTMESSLGSLNVMQYMCVCAFTF